MAAASRACTVVAAGVVTLLAACSPASGGPGPDAGAEASATSLDCPVVSQLAVCTPAPVSDCRNAGLGCGLDALPTGLACSASAPCAIDIYPCPDWQKYIGAERTDGYVCTCIAGHWSCDDCYEGAAVCQEAPDGAPYFGSPVDAATDAADATRDAPGDSSDEASVDATDASAPDGAPSDASPPAADADASLSPD